jgi:hypothetical protein
MRSNLVEHNFAINDIVRCIVGDVPESGYDIHQSEQQAPGTYSSTDTLRAGRFDSAQATTDHVQELVDLAIAPRKDSSSFMPSLRASPAS